MDKIARNLLMVLSLLLVCACVWAAPQKTRRGWTFAVEPGLKGAAPAVYGETASAATDLTVTLSTIDSSGTLRRHGVLMFEEAASFSVILPAVSADTFMDVRVTTGPDEQPVLFRWRTPVRPKGKDYRSYMGLSGYEAPVDFDEFWARARKELSAVPLRPHLQRVPDKDTTTGLLYRVDLPSVEETTIVAWCFVPRMTRQESGTPARKYPAVILTPGYGGHEPPVDRTSSGIITLSLNPRGHGPSRDYWRAPVDHLGYNIAEPEHCYYKLSFLDCLRGAEYLFSLPEVDTGRVAAEGGSQGGLLSIALAALEPRIACVTANVPSWAAFADRELLATAGTQMRVNRLLSLARGLTSETAIRRTLALTDAANMATRVHCPVQITVGGLDMLCPWPTGVVIYNRLPTGSLKEIVMFADAPHEVTRLMRVANTRWCELHLLR